MATMATISAEDLRAGDVIELEDLGREHVVQGPYRSARGIRFINLYGDSRMLRPNERVHLVARENPTGGPPWALILGLAAIGGGIFFLLRGTAQAAAAPPPARLPGTGTPSSKPAPGLPAQTQQPAAPTLDQFLAGSRAARQTFNIQAVAFEYGLTDAIPDGRFGPITQRIVNQAETAMNKPRTTGLVPESLRTVRLMGQSTANPTLRMLPMQLNPSVTAALNADALSADPQAVPIQ